MACDGLFVLAVFAALVSSTLAGVIPEAILSGDGQSLSVTFGLGNTTCKYNLVATNVFAPDAKITKYTQQGAEQHLTPASRTFISRETGMWATAILDSSDSLRLGVSGLFVCGDVLIDIPTPHHSIPTNDSVMALQTHSFSYIPNSGPAHPRNARGGRRLVGTVVSKEGYEIANETDDWELPPEISEFLWNTRSTWNGVKWYPGCYSGDSQMHVFKLGIVADVAAFQKHGNALDQLIESTIAKTSFIYESQFNIKLEIADLQIFKSVSSAPSYATDECPDMQTQLDRLTAGSRLSGGAVHLLTGCGKGSGVVGLAYVGSICRRPENTGVNQLHNSMSWITFAHELGHNYGGGHSFEEDASGGIKRNYGGIMDYGDGRLDGEYQFNTKYRKDEMCRTMNRAVNRCGGNFDAVTGSSTPTPPTPPTVGECDTFGWTNGAGYGCATYETDWCKDGWFRGIGAFHNYPDRNCCACREGSLRESLLSGTIIASPASLITLLAFILLLSPLH